jgi:hypothetical protein
LLLAVHTSSDELQAAALLQQGCSKPPHWQVLAGPAPDWAQKNPLLQVLPPQQGCPLTPQLQVWPAVQTRFDPQAAPV